MSKRKNFNELREKLRANPEARAKVDQYRLAMHDALALADLREARHVTQAALAHEFGSTQENISRVEHQEDVYVSTLRRYVAGLGGHLEIRAIFSDQTVMLEAPHS